MVDISFIYQNFPERQSIALQTSDPRFHQLASYVAEMQLDSIAATCESFFSEHIYDIRILGHYLYVFFYEKGLVAIPEIFKALTYTLENNWEKVGPLEDQQKYFFVAICELLSRIYKVLKACENQNDNKVWVRWIENLDVAKLLKVPQQSAPLRTNIEKRITTKNVVAIYEWLAKIEQWLVKFIRSQENNTTKEIETPTKEQKPQESDSEPKQNRAVDIFSEISYPLQQLMEKLKGFEILVKKNDMLRAAIIAKDIAHTLETFDPKYFPQLFASYFKLLSLHHQDIEDCWQQANSFHWKTLEQLYHLELKSFMDLT